MCGSLGKMLVSFVHALVIGSLQNGAEVYRKVIPSIASVTVERNGGEKVSGSGFLAIKDGILVTSWHLVRDGKAAIATFSDGATFECSGIVDKDEKRDIALVRVRTADRPLLRFSTAKAEPGLGCFIVGSPKGLDFSIAGGNVNPTRVEDGISLIQFSCAAYPGNSGGPLLDKDGEVLGVVSCQIKGSETLSFAVPASVAKGLDSTLATTQWDKVTSSISANLASGRVLDPTILGAPFWSGKREGYYEGTNSMWNVHLAYKPGAVASATNVVLGIAFWEFNQADNRYWAFKASDIRLLHDYLLQSIDKGTIDSLAKEGNKQSFILKGVPFLTKGIVYEATDLAVVFEVNPKSSNKGARWKYTVKAGEKTRWLNRDEASQLRVAIGKWLVLLKEVGIEL